MEWSKAFNMQFHLALHAISLYRFAAKGTFGLFLRPGNVMMESIKTDVVGTLFATSSLPFIMFTFLFTWRSVLYFVR